MAPAEPVNRVIIGWLSHEAEERFWESVGEHWKRARQCFVLHDRELDLYATGFRSKRREASFHEFYWLTFVVNLQRIMVFISTVSVMIFIAQFVRHVTSDGFLWTSTGADLFGLSWYGMHLYFLSMRHIPSLYKRVFALVYRCSMVLLPIYFVFDGCATDPAHALTHLIPMSTFGSFTCPYFVPHVLNLVGVAFIPIIWRLVMGKEPPTMPYLEIAAKAGVLVVIGTVLCSSVCIYRRQEWARTKSGRRRSRSDASPRSSRSPSPATRSRSRTRRHSHSSGSVSPLPRVREEGQFGYLRNDKMNETAAWVRGGQWGWHDEQGRGCERGGRQRGVLGSVEDRGRREAEPEGGVRGRRAATSGAVPEQQ